MYLQLPLLQYKTRDRRYYLPVYGWVTPAIGTLGQRMKKTKIAIRLVNVQTKHNLMIPEQRSLNLFTRNPPRNVPPPPAGGPPQQPGNMA
uniref:Uncharacterized protein n=2 Tax=Anas TaxID=8835 RepID=A0A8B9VRZ4_9AVES